MKKPTFPNSSEQPDRRDLSLVAALQVYRQQEGLTESTADNELLGSRIGVSGTYVYRYFANAFVGNLEAFEAKARAMLDNQTEKAGLNSKLVKSGFVVDRVERFLLHVKAHGFVGIGHGPAGIGKTCALRLYATKDRTSILLTASAWLRGRGDITRALSKITGIRATKAQTLDEALVSKLTNSGRLLMIDNGQRLTEGARKWLNDFRDATELPIALIGNPEIERQWARNDQHHSRVGIVRDLGGDLPATAKETAASLIRLHLPEHQTTAIVKAAEKDVLSSGSSRAVLQRCRLTVEILKGGQITDPLEAFTLAKTQLIEAA